MEAKGVVMMGTEQKTSIPRAKRGGELKKRRTYRIKIVLIGDPGVGKSCLRKAYMGEKQTAGYMMTLGADFAKKDVQIYLEDLRDYVLVEALIWDVAGQDHFKSIRETFYESASGGLLVLDITRPGTFESAKEWIDELWSHTGKGPVPLAFLVNKIDLRGSNPNLVMSVEETASFLHEIRSWAVRKAHFSYPVAHTSAIHGTGVAEGVESLLKEIVSGRDFQE